MFEDRDSRYWHDWAMRALLLLGAAHFLAGVVFFFAYNWDDLTPFTKFALLQGGIIVSFAIAMWRGLDSTAGRGLLIAASVFTGVLLAVIGQVYQTGADAWELFAAWAALILAWVIAARSGPHWFLWFVIVVIACSLYGEQVLVALGFLDRHDLVAAVGLVPIVFLAAREFVVSKGGDWLDESWMRRAFIVISLAMLSVPALSYVFTTDAAILGFAAFVLVCAAAGYIYSQVMADFSMVAIVTAFSTLLLMAGGGRLIHEAVGFWGSAGGLVFSLLLLGGWCAFLTTMAVRFLKATSRMLGGADD